VITGMTRMRWRCCFTWCRQDAGGACGEGDGEGCMGGNPQHPGRRQQGQGGEYGEASCNIPATPGLAIVTSDSYLGSYPSPTNQP
jgi:hypothetical protein